MTRGEDEVCDRSGHEIEQELSRVLLSARAAVTRELNVGFTTHRSLPARY